MDKMTEINTKRWESIDPTRLMNKEDFMFLYNHLPLNDSEKSALETEYFPAYEKFIEAGVDPKTSWLATRNLFINKNQQIGNRIK